MYKNILLLPILLLLAWACSNPNNANKTLQNADSTMTANTDTLIKTSQLEKVTHPTWAKNATMYEVNLRQFSKAGTFKAFEKEISRLKAMGVDIIWFMPIHPIGIEGRKDPKNNGKSMGSYYAVKDYKAVSSDYGTIEDFKSLVDTIHRAGMYVIIDWVANHTSPDNAWVKQNPEWYNKDSTGKIVPPVPDWSDTADLNFDNQDMQNAMIDALKFWVSDCKIDGYRCDVAGMVPISFWNKVRPELKKINPNIFMLAEAWEPNLHTYAFDATYDWELHHVMNDIAKGKKDGLAINDYLAKIDTMYENDNIQLQFTSNHDENSWNGTEFERLGAGVEAFAVLAATIKGMPLVYSGQESANKKRLEFFYKDAINWGNYSKKEFYTTLLNLKHQNNALANGSQGANVQRIKTDNDKHVLVFKRQKDTNEVVVVINLSNKPQKVIFEATKNDYTDAFTKKMVTLNEINTQTLKPYSYQILSK